MEIRACFLPNVGTISYLSARLKIRGAGGEKKKEPNNKNPAGEMT